MCAFVLYRIVRRVSWSTNYSTKTHFIVSFFTMPHKTPRNILLSYFSFPLPEHSTLYSPIWCLLAYYYCQHISIESPRIKQQKTLREAHKNSTPNERQTTKRELGLIVNFERISKLLFQITRPWILRKKKNFAVIQGWKGQLDVIMKNDGKTFRVLRVESCLMEVVMRLFYCCHGILWFLLYL